MLNPLIHFAGQRPFWTVALALLMAAAGVWAYQQQTIDAYPDISPQVVMILSTYPGRATEEVERQVTVPIELAMGNVPYVESIRSRSIFGLSVVELMFAEGTEPYFARQRVQERLASVALPAGVESELAPLATAYGEIYRYQLTTDGKHDLMELRTLNDWSVIPRLVRTPGVADVVNFGGNGKQYVVTLLPAQLERYSLTLKDVIAAVQENNANAGGSVLRSGSMSLVIRGRGAFEDIGDIERTVINTIDGTPVYLGDVAEVSLDSPVPSGIFSKDAVDEAVEGIVLMRRGENPSQVLERVKESVAQINAEVLPDGVAIVPFYDRTFLVDNTLHTVAHSIVSGVTLVVLVLLLFLGSPAMALLVVLTIPFSLLVALVLMYLTDIPIGLLSIGAIDFGILVDGAVIMVDNVGHRLSQQPGKPIKSTILAAAAEVQRPIFFSMLMIIGAYLPLLTLTSIEGLLFRPMAITVVYALIGAVVFTLFVLPSLATLLLRRGYRDFENPLLTWCRPRYEQLVLRMSRRPWSVLAVSGAVVGAVCVLIIPRLGTEYLPYLDEGVIWIRANFPEGTAVQQTAAYGNEIRAIVRSFPDVAFVTAQAGRNDSGTDPFPPSRLELMVGPKPREEWVSRSKQELVAKIGERLRAEFPTTRFNFTQPIIDSVTEDTNGTSANLAVQLTGEDLEILRRLAEEVKAVVQAVPGAVDVNIEQEGPQPQLLIQPDRALCATYNVSIDDVNQLINTALGGEPVGTLYDGEKRFDIVTRFDRAYLTSPEAVGRLPVFSASGVPVPLSQVAKFEVLDGQTIIARDGGRRRLTVRTDIVGRDQGSFVREVQRRFDEHIELPAGYNVQWLGMYENLERASRHFVVVLPITVALIYALLVLTFGTHREALLVLLSIPFAAVGGVLALYLRGMHFNVSNGVGFAALFGISIMNGVLMVEWISNLWHSGASLDDAITKGAGERLRPILMASLVAILGLLPASVASGLGSDVQRPLATVIVWGLISSSILTLFVVPGVYRLFAPVRDSEAASHSEITLAEPAPGPA
jgi:cobalt-zinc-cadmium resistance protein CzcA